MTNFEKWHCYCKHLVSPELYIDFGYYAMIGAALQRRVWVGPVYSPLFANSYIVLCGGPGTGKGLVIKQVRTFLGHHKLHSVAEQERLQKEQERILKMGNKRVNGAVFSSSQNSESNTNSFNKKLGDEPLLFKMGAESYGSYQALVSEMADSYTGIAIKKPDGTSGTYLHSSLVIALEELASLFRQHTEDLANFLLQTYDCGDYKYKLLSRENDRIKACCLSILAGTTPSFMQETFDDRLLNEGFSSRCWYICATESRFNKLFYPELDQEQQLAKLHILQHLRQLKDLYGQAVYELQAVKFLEDWWEQFPKSSKPNPNPKLEAYYARKNIHVQKLAMAIHYGEHLNNNIITLTEVKAALAMLDKAEKSMHLALTFKGKNPLLQASRVIEAHLKSVKFATKQELLAVCWDYIREAELDELINSMIVMGKLTTQGGKICLK